MENRTITLGICPSLSTPLLHGLHHDPEDGAGQSPENLKLMACRNVAGVSGYVVNSRDPINKTARSMDVERCTGCGQRRAQCISLRLRP